MTARKRRTTDKRPPIAPPTRPRRWWFVAIGAAALVVASLAFVFLRPRSEQADLRQIRGQNVLLVTIDTLRADAPSCYGGPAATPALDRVAAEGVRFEFAHAHAVLTLPSHASILTGEYPFQHGLRSNSGYRLPKGARTIATLLKQAGYQTAAFVGGFPVHSLFGLNTGFEEYDDHFGDNGAPVAFNMPERPASAVVPLARKWIADAEGGTGSARPWFVWVHLYDPHAPYQPPPPFDAQYASQPYYGEVAATDAALGPLLDDVRNSGRPTLVIVTGDHGEGLGDHGEEAHGIFAYESTLRVPLLIAQLHGGASPTSEVCPVPVRHVDLLPTILDAVALPIPPGLPGRTLLPRKERDGGAAARTTYFEAMSGMLDLGWAPLTGVLLGRDKYIDLPITERYDLASDASEQSNLAGRVPERDRVLGNVLAEFKPVMPGRRTSEDPETSARLRALGYVSGNATPKTRYTEDDDPKRLIQFDNAIHRAVEAFGAGRIDEAAGIYRGVIERRPDMGLAYFHLAMVEWRRGNAGASIDVLRRAVARGITDSRVLTQLGACLTDTGQAAEAIKILEPLTSDPAADADTVVSLGIAYARAHRPNDARHAFERLAERMPGSSTPYENLGVLALEQGDLAGAQAYFERALALAPRSARAYAGLGAAAFRRGDRATAYGAWAHAVELDPNNVDALYSLGLNLARDGRMNDARPYLERFLSAAPPSFDPQQRREIARLLEAGR